MDKWALERLNDQEAMGEWGQSQDWNTSSGFMYTWPLPSGQTDGKKDPLCLEKKIEREGIHFGGQCGIVDSGF